MWIVFNGWFEMILLFIEYYLMVIVGFIGILLWYFNVFRFEEYLLEKNLFLLEIKDNIWW